MSVLLNGESEILYPAAVAKFRLQQQNGNPMVVVTRPLDKSIHKGSDSNRLKFLVIDSVDRDNIGNEIFRHCGKRPRISDENNPFLSGFSKMSHRDYYNHVINYFVKQYGVCSVWHPYRNGSVCHDACTKAAPHGYCECMCIDKNHGTKAVAPKPGPGGTASFAHVAPAYKMGPISRLFSQKAMPFEDSVKPGLYLATFEAS